MVNISVLDWALASGVLLLGGFLAVYFKAKYQLPKREFAACSFFIAGLGAILIAAYHVLRGMLALTP